MKKSLLCIVMMLLPILANADPEEIEINPNPTVVIVHGQERDDMGDDNHPDGTGQIWDNQFFIVANRTLNTGEVTVLEFDYVATKNAKTTTQCHVLPGVFIHWGCISDVNFTTAEQHLTKTFTVPQEANGMQSIAFNMAEIKDACDYTIKNVVWKLSDNSDWCRELCREGRCRRRYTSIRTNCSCVLSKVRYAHDQSSERSDRVRL